VEESIMIRFRWISLALALTLCVGDAWALPRGSSGGGGRSGASGPGGAGSSRGGGGNTPNRGGGGGASPNLGGGGGGGGLPNRSPGKPSLSATPSFSGGNALGGGSRSPGGGNLGGNRPGGGAGNASNRLPGSGGNLGNSSPGGGGNRPNIGGGNTNLGQRPGAGGNAVGRPGFLPSSKPNTGIGSSQPNLGGVTNNRPNIGTNRPGTTPGNRPNIGGNTPGANLPGANLPGNNLPGNNLPGVGNRPNINPGTRPSLPGNNNPLQPGGGNIANRPNVTPGNRPAIGNRPNINPGNQIRPGIGNDTNIGNRPNINNGNQIGIIDRDKTNITNRPGINIDNSTNIGGNNPWYNNRPTRPGYESRPNINNGNLGIGVNVGSNNGNRINVAAGNNVFAPTINNNIHNGPVVSNRPWYGQPWNAPTYQNHYGWHHGYWNYWPPTSYYPPAAFATGIATGWLLSAPNTVYVNPYCAVPTTTSTTTIIYDYSQPIPVTPPPTTPPVNVNVTVDASTTDPGQPPQPNPPVEDPKTKAAVAKFDEARLAFKAGKYDDALEKVNSAIQDLPGDPVLHEFRSLVLFAQQNYTDAAGTIYAVLAAGPGWDWDTLKTLYPNEETYTNQLRALEEFSNAHPDAADARFLLAYHYLTLGYTDEAKAELEVVSQLQPKDELSPQLVKLLSGEAVPSEAESTNS